VRFRFLLGEIITGFRRNITMTIAMILTTAISIGLFGGALLVWRLAVQSEKLYLSRVESQVFLDGEISAKDRNCESPGCQALKQIIESRDDVDPKTVRFVNREAAYNEQVLRVPAYKDIATQEKFPASFKVKLKDPNKHEAFDAAMRKLPHVIGVLNQKELVDRLFSVLYSVRNAAFAIAVVQAIGAILLIANMVQVSAFTRRTEIGIMRLVGASRWYTQVPFLVEAMLAALAGVVIAIGGLIFVRAAFLENTLKQFGPLIARVDYYDIIYITPYLVLVGVLMAGVTAYATLRLYVRR
jgi:cell division transport system permease protein